MSPKAPADKAPTKKNAAKKALNVALAAGYHRFLVIRALP